MEGSACEGCEKPATMEDGHGVPLCDGCAMSLMREECDRVLGLQDRTRRWMHACFGDGPKVLNMQERALRLLEEAVELAQAEGVRLVQARAVVRRVYSRPPGDPTQEAAGVGVTLLAWGAASGRDVLELTETELQRIERPEVMAKVRRKQAEKWAAGTSAVRFDG